MINRFFTYICLSLLLMIGTGQAQVFDFPPSVPLDLRTAVDNEARQLQRQASLHENRGRYQEALDIYLDLHQRHPGYTPFYEGAIRGYINLQKFDQGLVWVDSLREVMQGSTKFSDLTVAERVRLANYIVDGGRFCGKLGRREEALGRWEEVYLIPQVGSNPFFRLFSAMIDIRYLDGMDEMTKRAREVTGIPSLLSASLANFWANRGQLDRAIGEWLWLMEVQPRQSRSVKNQILNLPDDENTRNQVEESLMKALSREAIKIHVVELLADFYFRNRQWEAAHEYFRIADQLGGKEGDALVTFAENLINENRPELALQVLDDLNQTYPQLVNQPRISLARGRALEATGAYTSADSIYNLITTSEGLHSVQGQDALLKQAQMRLDILRQPEEARQLLEDGLKRIPRMRNRGEVLLLIGDTYIAERKLDKARETYLATAQEQGKGYVEIRSRALVNAAKVDFYLNENDQAIEKLKKATMQSPSGILTNDALYMLQLLRNGETDTTGLQLIAQAELERRLTNTTKAESLYTAAAQSAKSHDIILRSLWNLAEIQREDGEYLSALEVLESSASRFPKSLEAPRILLEMGDIYQNNLLDTEAALEKYEKILIDYPQSLLVEEARRRIRKIEATET
ncbi:hypothetical protein CEE37_03870 [candidate division LCP-89 bacterium B3_LCP]|uniref:Outer membrane lipoprotein BamD-like domain-containing protein n=1 Tax=candidate division LCP-89 bacterium B3_LCP TaxID=2012998 RepID=A0A532V3C1_UNCL8|nr:MAG: hypothetical protein CEE37_03870 [candidate division LCP-89 bacterium B3_LCP]